MSSLDLIAQRVSSSPVRSDLPSRLLSAAEVAEFMGVTVRTVRRWQSEGRIAPIRLSTGTIRFAPSSIETLFGDDSSNESVTNKNDGTGTTAPPLETSPARTGRRGTG